MLHMWIMKVCAPSHYGFMQMAKDLWQPCKLKMIQRTIFPPTKPQGIVFEFVSLWCQISFNLCMNIEQPTLMQLEIEKET